MSVYVPSCPYLQCVVEVVMEVELVVWLEVLLLVEVLETPQAKLDFLQARFFF